VSPHHPHRPYRPLVAGFVLAVVFGLGLAAGLWWLVHPASTLAIDLNAPTANTIDTGVTEPLPELIVRVLNYLLGFLGLVAVIMIIYGGYTWMTAAGNEDKIDRAKKIILGAVIGLIIVMISWAIVFFVGNTFLNNGSPGPGGNSGNINGGGCPSCGGSSTFTVNWVYPANGATNVKLCEAVQANFSDDVNGASVNAGTWPIVDDPTTTQIIGSYGSSGPSAAFTHLLAAGGQEFAPNTSHTATVTSGVVDAALGTPATPKSWSFTTGTDSDITAPTVTATWPTSGATDICLNSEIVVQFSEPMLASSIDLANVTVSPVIALTGMTMPNPTTVRFRTAGPMAPNTAYTITLVAGPNQWQDTCGNPMASNATWSFTTGTTVDCVPQITSVTPSGFYEDPGGTLTISGSNFTGIAGNVVFDRNVVTTTPGFSDTCFDSNFFAGNPAGTGTACITNWTDNTITVKVPASGGSSNGAVDGSVKVVLSQPSNSVLFDVQAPHITSLSPGSGGPGQWVTINGADFGPTTGRVVFRKVGSEIDGASVTCATANWTDTRILTKLPENAPFVAGDSLVVQIIRPSIAGAERHSNLRPFTVSTQVGPGLCSVTPSCGLQGSTVTLDGERFGNGGAGSEVQFNTTPATASPWGDTTIVASVPNIGNTQNADVRVMTPAGTSNGLDFDIPCGDVPAIVDNPTCDIPSGILASPTPRPNAVDVCLNTTPYAEFTLPMNPATLTSANITLEECNAGATFDDTLCNLVGYTISAAASSFSITPSAPLVGDTWYQVTVKRTVEDASGVQMNLDYDWHFRAKPVGSGDCPLSSVAVNLNPTLLTTIGSTSAATGLAVGPACEVINPSAYTWAWSSSNALVATIGSGTGPAETATAAGQGQTTIQATAEGQSGSRNLRVQLAGPGPGTPCNDTAGPACVPNDSKCNPPELTCNPGSCTCQYAAPQITSVDPPAGSANVCRNAVVRATFDMDMNPATLTDAGIQLTLGTGADGAVCAANTDCASAVCTSGVCVGDQVSGRLAKAARSFTFSPGLLEKNATYTMTVGAASPVVNTNGVALAPYSWSFSTANSDNVCAIDTIEVDPPSWIYTTAGETLPYLAQAFSGATPIGPISGLYEWAWDWQSNDTTLVTVGGSVIDTETGTAQNKNGITTITARATGTVGWSGSVSGSTNVRVFLCTTPRWLPDPVGNNPNNPDSLFNFMSVYCRDNGLPYIPTVQQVPNPPASTMIQREYFFIGQEVCSDDATKGCRPEDGGPSVCGAAACIPSDDAIGIRIIGNLDHQSPRLWFAKTFPTNSDTTKQNGTVDGYEALTVGRTTYVNSANVSGNIYSNIYAISYSENASAATQQIYDQIVSNFLFNTNLTASDKTMVTRDTARLGHVAEVANALVEYKDDNDQYPPLVAGSYLGGKSTSAWPSWQATLGNVLGQALPIDPANSFTPACPAPDFEPSTCWNETDKIFQCGLNSHIYMYTTSDGGQTGHVLTNLEYSGGSWVNPPDDASPPNWCSGSSSCACFNYQVDLP